MSEQEKCSRCGKDLGPVMILDSSTASGMFCEECHREDMREMYEKRSKNNHA